AQSDLICAPQPIIIDQTQAAQIGGFLRAEADQRLLRAVTRFQARRRADRRLRAVLLLTGRDRATVQITLLWMTNVRQCRLIRRARNAAQRARPWLTNCDYLTVRCQ